MDKYEFEKKVFELVSTLENSAFMRGNIIASHARAGHQAELPAECFVEDCYYARRYKEELHRDLDAGLGLRRLVSDFLSEVK